MPSCVDSRKMLLLLVAIGDFRMLVVVPLDRVICVEATAWWFSDSSVRDAAVASVELFAGGSACCLIFFVVGLSFCRIFFSFPFTFDEDFLRKIIWSLAFDVSRGSADANLFWMLSLELIRLAFVSFGFFLDFVLAVLRFWFWCDMKTSVMMLFVPFWLLLLRFGVLADSSSADEAVEVPMRLTLEGDNRLPLPLQPSQ